MISSKFRFHGHGSLRFVHTHSQPLRSRHFVVKVMPNPRRKTSRFAVVVSKKTLKSAVGRNRIRRRVYELIRQHMTNIDRVVDVVVIVTSPEVVSAPIDELNRSLVELFIKSGIYK